MKRFLRKIQPKLRVQAVIAAVLLLFVAIAPRTPIQAASLSDQIRQKDSESQELQSRISELEGEIKTKQTEAASLRNQVGIFEADIKKKQLEIDKKNSDISKTKLEIQRTESSIVEAQKEIDHQKIVLAEYIRTLSYSDDTSAVELLLSDHSFSDLLDNMQHIESLQGSVGDSLDNIKTLKSELEAKKQELESNKTNLEKQKKEVEFKKSELVGAQQEKEELLVATENAEDKYQSLLSDAKKDYNSKQSEIDELERRIREQNTHYGTPAPYASGFVWPLPAGAGVITCPFHCSTYFKGLVHTGTDIGAPSGTPIYSATSGVVVHAGWSSNRGGYGQYVAVSSGNLLIIYGHMSAVLIGNGTTVNAGDRIGSVGSTGFSTGPHLHFEIRKDGVPVNAMNFY